MDFSKINVSTITVMVYSNMLFDLNKLFNKMNIYRIENPPLTKKKKLPNIKQIDAPYGSIISLRIGNKFKGLVTKIVENESTYFLNQITCILSLGNKKNINIFIFKSSFKIVGCKNQSMTEEIILILWENYIRQHKDCYTIVDNENPNFTFETVMTNIDFSLGFPINRKNLNTLMNDPQFKDHIKLSKYETTGDSHVNIYFYTHPQANYYYWKLIDDGETFIYEKVDNIKYKNKKKIKKKYTTFLVFHSSKTIATARYSYDLEPNFNYFMKIIENNRKIIEK